METRAENTESGTRSGDEIKEKEIVLDRAFDLPLNKIWRAWTQPESFKKWWGPKNYTCPSSTMDFRIGGKYLHCMRSSTGEEFWSTGIYKEIEPYKKLMFTDSISNSKGNIIPASEANLPGEWPRELLVTLNFKEEGEGTRIQFQHQGVPAEMYEDCMTSWKEAFDKLEENID